MDAFVELLKNPLVWKLLGSYWLVSALVGAMKTPTTNSSEIYEFVLRFSHAFVGNVNRAAVALKVPGAQDGEPK